MIVELTPLEAQQCAEALVRLTASWYRGNAHNKFLLKKHLGSYTSLQVLAGKLHNAIRQIDAPVSPVSIPFDLELAKENETDAITLFPGVWG